MKLRLDRNMSPVPCTPMGQDGDEQRIDRLSRATALFAGLARADSEVAGIAYLAEDARLLALRVIRGGADRVAVPPRLLTLDALAFNARAVIVAHNHPSGDPQPSRHDLAHLRCAARTLGALDIRLIDHLIVTRETMTSLRALGMI
ncbi:JAB domain-containing protein [Sphingomonas floccifaciens]|uniref:JAB domain-containing protein n=1 Tax=Sphingomonas floccifaciens TaxID=1844115 RepID=A0ABW4NCH5_9SPHN